MSAEGVTYEQVMSAAMRAVDQAEESVNQIESEFPFLADLGEHSLESEGIDIGRNGNVTPWDATPWTGSFDFREKTTATVSGVQLPNDTLEITARPDTLNRGSGWKFTVTKQAGETEFFNRLLMTSIADLRDEMGDFVEKFYSHLKSPGDSEPEPAPTPPSMEVVEELEYGWVLVVRRSGSGSSSGSSSEYLVLGQSGGSRVYLNEQGEVVEEEFTFPSKSRARKAFRRWRDRREGNISEARSELNETMRERAEQFEALEEQQEEQTNVVTESNVVEGETKVVEGDTQTVTSAGSGQRGASSANSGSITLPDVPRIPVAGVVLVVLAVLYMVMSDSDMEGNA